MFNTNVMVPDRTPHQQMMANFAVVLTRRLGDHVYAGTVGRKTKMQRRAADKMASRSRRTNRSAA